MRPVGLKKECDFAWIVYFHSSILLIVPLNALSANRLTNFLARFRDFKLDQEAARLAQLRQDFARFQSALARLGAEDIKRNAADAPRFNIFEVLGLARNEVRLHSAFLGHLLDPSAEHGQGQLFLLGFLEMARTRGLKVPDFLPQTGWRIETERFAGKYGRLDIVIENARGGFLLVIENKIDADLRPSQLEDYREWLKLQGRRKGSIRQLIFLTPDGRKGGAEDAPLSYRHDISRWLTSTAAACSPRLRETLLQYRQLTVSLIEEEGEKPK